MDLILKDSTTYTLSDEDYNRYAKAYPNIDIDQQFLIMQSWCIDNPTKRKTRRGTPAFINSWLSRENRKNAAGRNTGAVRSRDTTIEHDLLNREWAL